MTSLAHGNIKMAVSSLRSSKWRSFLTMLGIIIGIVSVVTTISLGEGLKRQMSQQVSELGQDLITVVPGQFPGEQPTSLSNFRLSRATITSTLTEKDIPAITALPNVKAAAPLSFITFNASYEGRQLAGVETIATHPAMGQILGDKVQYGSFFGESDTNKHVAIIGKRVAERLFRENVPMGKIFTLGGEEYIVRGVLAEFNGSPLSLGTDFNNTIIIPFETAKHQIGSVPQIREILVAQNLPSETPQTIAAVSQSLLAAHAGQEDFTVLPQRDTVAVFSEVLDVLTVTVAAIAGISLFVAGIGIMNIMLVSVAERTHEIGVRKAVGANNRQIRGQFLVEAVMLSLVGGIIGITFSMIVVYFIRVLTDLQPVVTWPSIALAGGISLIIGTFFGIVPAAIAARKDPIEALRHE